MQLKDLLKALEEMAKSSPHLLEQEARLVTDETISNIVLVNVYGDDRVVFLHEFIPEVGADNDSAMDAG